MKSRSQVEDPTTIDAKLRALDPTPARIEWTAHGNPSTPGMETLTYLQILNATRAHPETKEEIWFNGLHTNHRSYYDRARHIDTSDGSPMDTFFADQVQQPLAEDGDVIARVRGAIWRASVLTRLKSGDLVLVDNRLAGHGRMPWTPGVARRMALVHLGD